MRSNRTTARRLEPNNKPLEPFLKWAGGKRQLLEFILPQIPQNFGIYYEPFLGAGAVFFALQPRPACINDANTELVNCYLTIKSRVRSLITDLRRHKNTSEYFYRIRELDRATAYPRLSAVKKASRIIYLNKTCYNGLYRVNSKGHFNVPFGKYKNPQYADPAHLHAVSKLLNDPAITITNCDFEIAVRNATRGDFVYFDPPYDPISATSSFTDYAMLKFGKPEQERLQSVYADLSRRGCQVMLSNSATDFILSLYRDYHIIRIPAKRNINSVASGRGKIDELLILNYPPIKT